LQDERREQGKPVGWDILWQRIQAHCGCKGLLKYFHNGKVAYISSDVQQGDPLGITLFALAIHPILIKLGSQHNVLITADADNAKPI
jgi:hypothetical protein